MTPGPERWYRLLTLAYPRRWRRAHADELVGSLLDLADREGRRRPAPRDVLDLLVHGLACRARTPVAALPARARSAAGALGLASGAALSLVLLALGGRPDPAASVGPVVYGAWLLALAGATVRPGRALPAVAAAVGATAPVATALGLADTRPSLTILGFLTLCGLLTLLEPPAARDVLLPMAVAAALVAGPLLPYRRNGILTDGSYYPDGPQHALALSALVTVALLAAVAARRRRAAGAGTALAALPWLAFGLALLGPGPSGGDVRPALLAAAAVAALLATLRAFGLRLRVEWVPPGR